MGWIDINDKYPPQGLYVLVEASGWGIGTHNESVMADHDFYLGCWLVPSGQAEGEWLLDTGGSTISDPTIHAWMPLPKHYQQKKHFGQEPDLMEHAMFEDDPEWLYKGDAVYEQMSLEEFLK